MDSSKTRFWQASDLGLAASKEHADPHTTTRIMPIEQLLPAARDVDAETTNVWSLHTTDAMSEAPTVPSPVRRIAKHLLLAVLTLLAVVTWKLQSLPRRPVAAAHVEAAANEPTKAPAAAQEPPRAEPAAPGTRKPGATAEADAVRLLIAGDDLGAARVYADLAVAHPDQRAFGEAARILALRRKE